MKKNVGNTDAVVRATVGTAAVMFNATGVVSDFWGWVLLAGGTLSVVTAFTGFCPIWAVLGIDTYEKI